MNKNSNLKKFLDDAHHNQKATILNEVDWFRIITDIDDCFSKSLQYMLNPKQFYSPLFLARAHSAYRAASGLVLATQINESLLLVRSCLEYSAYALVIYKSKDLAKIWEERNSDDSSIKKMKKSFTHKKILEIIESENKQISSIYSTLYERSIDFGAHPNPNGLFASLEINKGTEKSEYLQKYFQGDGQNLIFGLKTLAQTGVCSLDIFNFIFPEKFKLLGITDKINTFKDKL